MRLHLVTNMITGNKPLWRRFGCTQFDQELMSAGSAPQLVMITRTCTHVRIEIRTHTVIHVPRRFILPHAVPRTPLGFTGRPSINLFNPIIRILCVRHRSRIGDGDREPQRLSVMIDAANFEEGTLWDLAGLQNRVRVDPSITYVEGNVTRTITQEYALFG